MVSDPHALLGPACSGRSERGRRPSGAKTHPGAGRGRRARGAEPHGAGPGRRPAWAAVGGGKLVKWRKGEGEWGERDATGAVEASRGTAEARRDGRRARPRSGGVGCGEARGSGERGRGPGVAR